jgi:hypothetical protein
MKKYFIFALAAAFAFAACQEDPEVTKDEENKDNTEQGGQEQGGQEQGGQEGNQTTTKTVCINEVCGVSGYKGVELYNPNDAEVSVEGYTLIKNEAADAPTWTGTADDKIPAKGFYVIKSKKETTEIDAVANATAKDSFSPGQTLKLELKDASGNVISTFVRGVAPWGTVIEVVDCAFGLTTDGGDTWKLLGITIGATNNGAENKGDIPQV